MGRTPLAHAARFYPYPELVAYLLKHDPDVNAVDHYGSSVIAGCRHASILKLLLRWGANVNTSDEARARKGVSFEFAIRRNYS